MLQLYSLSTRVQKVKGVIPVRRLRGKYHNHTFTLTYYHTVTLSNCHASNYPFPLNISMKLLDIDLYFLYSILVNNMNISVHCPLNLLTGITPFTFWTLVEKENLEDIRSI